MNIQQFQYILAVARLRHFERAAEQCYVSQSTLSTMISRFEDEIGIRIFDRKRKPVGLTTEGSAIVSQLKNITGEIHHLEELVQEIKGEISGTFRIACIPTVAPFLLPRFLSDFSKKFPKLHLIIKENTTAEILKKLRSREIDVGILSVPNFDREITEYPLYQEPFYLYDQSGQSPPEISVDDLNLDNFWLLEEGHCMRAQILEICNKNQKDVNPALNINFKAGSIGSLMHFVKGSQGKTMLPFLSLQDIDKADRKNLSRFKDPVPRRQIGLATHIHFVRTRLLDLLRDEIIQSLPVGPEIKQIEQERIHKTILTNL